jgi:hypothetical protein
MFSLFSKKIHAVPSANYYESTSLEQRIKDFDHIYHKHPEKYPCIVINEDNMYPLSKQKFLISKSMTFGEFATVLRQKHITLTPDVALFYFVGKFRRCVHHSQTIGELAAEFANPDDRFLTIRFRGESAFG